MRVWHKTTSAAEFSSPTNDARGHKKSVSLSSPFHAASAALKIQSSKEFQHIGPELILTPVSNPLVEQHMCCGSDFGDPIPLSKRFASFGSLDGSRLCNNNNYLRNGSSGTPKFSQRQPSPVPSPKLGTVTIPIKDIMLIDVDGNANNSYQTNITTMSSGYFEFNMESLNGRLLLMAFLKANLPKEKVLDGTHLVLPRSPSNITQNTTGSTKSFDVEAFTASRMAERLKSESISEKLQRRIYRLVSSLEEMSNSISECGCGCGNATVSPAPVEGREKRDSPPRKMVEMASDNTTVEGSTGGRGFSSSPNRFEMRPPVKYSKRQELKATHMPSGLSVESDPEVDTCTVAAVATTIAD